MLFAILAALPLAGPLVTAPPTQEIAVRDNRPEVATLAKQFRIKLMTKNGEGDEEALADFNSLVRMWKRLGPKDRKEVLKRADGAFKVKRKPLEDGAVNDRLFLGLAESLAQCGPESADLLMSWIGHKRFRENNALQRRLILSLGETQVPDGAEFLIDLLTHEEPIVQGAAAEALGEYRDASEEIRKEAFEGILKQIVPLHNETLNAPVDPTQQQRYDIISAPMVTTLQRLSKHTETDPPQWQHWWNKNKKLTWE